METSINDPFLQKLLDEKKAGDELQIRKHADWNDNYELYRNKVKTNRLTQRQAVNIPLMKETIKTILSKVDDPPNVDWKEMGGDELREIIYQEIWDTNYRDNKLELVDVLDKKNVLLYGISAKKLNINEDGVEATALDVFDVVYDPLMSAGDIETARFIIHKNIFKSVREILADDRYTQKGKDSLKLWADAPAGIVQGQDNKEEWEKKMKRLQDMGVSSGNFHLFAGGDRIVNLTEHYTTMWNPTKKDWERRVVVYADNQILLSDDLLEDLIGVKVWPFVVWSEDPETNDIYPDSVADLVRTPNKILNVWFSQLIENRTLKNFQMHWFLPSQGYTPQTYTPGPGVMLPAPPGDDINKVIKPVEISGLDDTFEAINILTNIIERGTGATAIEKGQGESGTQTLGEIQVLVGKAMERTVSIAKFYRMSWYEFCTKWDMIMHANAPKVINLYKTSRSGKVYAKKVFAGDWKSSEGYIPTISSSSEQEQESFKTIQKFMFTLQQFPNNIELRKIGQKRILEALKLTPQELRKIEEAEEQSMATAQQPQEPQQNPLEQGIEQKVGVLQALGV